MDRKSPDVSQIVLSDLQERPFPMLTDFRIVFSEHAYEVVHAHTKENTSVEICGVLIGDIFKDNRGPYLEITDAIRGEGAVNLAGQVTFTQETWSYINGIKDTKFSDKRIVGWYHTHPRFGIFLSPQDIFIQENFFSQPWQVAFVIDPVAEEEGFFIWQEGKPVRIERYWIAGRERSISEDAALLKGKVSDGFSSILDKTAELGKRRFRPVYFIIGMILICLLLALLYVKTEKIFSSLTTQLSQGVVGDAIPKAEEIKIKLAQYAYVLDRPISVVQKGNHVWCSGEVYTWRQKEMVNNIAASIEGVESVDIHGIVVTHRYITSRGESLNSIAAKIYGNSEKWINIFNANKDKLPSPDKIQPATILVLPEY
jgi:proteasome lid subunit RPN8/RPN11